MFHLVFTNGKSVSVLNPSVLCKNDVLVGLLDLHGVLGIRFC